MREGDERGRLEAYDTDRDDFSPDDQAEEHMTSFMHGDGEELC